MSSEVVINGGSGLGNALNDLLTCGDIVPGDAVGYQTCKDIYTHHPLGGKITRISDCHGAKPAA